MSNRRMSDRRTLLSRPRTRVYDCNYNIGEGYYKPMVEELDRKYSGRSTTSPFSSTPGPTFTPSSNRFKEDDDFPPPPRRVFSASPELDSLATDRRHRINGDADRRHRMNGDAKTLEEDLEEDIINSMKRLKAIRAAKSASTDDDFMSSSSHSNGIQRKKRVDITSKILDSVGINGKSHEALEEEILKKRTTKIPSSSIFDEADSSFTKWSALKESSFAEDSDLLAARARARQSRARIADIENEMDALAERGAARERRVHNIKALIAGEEPLIDGLQSSYKSSSLSSSSKSTKSSKKVSF